MPHDKPRTRDGYTREETELVKSALLSVAVTLGAYMDDLCVIGGLAPLLLIDLQAEAEADPGHPGTIDLDTVGPARVAGFEGASGEAADEIAADTHGSVDDLLDACAERGLLTPPYAPPAVRGQSSA